MNELAGRGEWTIRVARRHIGWFSLLTVLAAGCDLPGRPRAADRPVPSDQVVDFAVLYHQNCAGCHGADGKLGPAPPLNNEVFLEIVPDSLLLRIITEGRPGTPMPAFAQHRGGPLTDAQVKVLAEGIKPRWKSDEPLPGPLPRYSAAADGPGGTEAGDVERGRKVIARACAGCHGARGEGSDDRDEGAGAIHDAAFLSLISDQALRRYVITGRPDLGMPNFAAKGGRPEDFRPLTSGEIADIVALLAHWRRGGSEQGH